jgi:hypothetical protein
MFSLPFVSRLSRKCGSLDASKPSRPTWPVRDSFSHYNFLLPKLVAASAGCLNASRISRIENAALLSAVQAVSCRLPTAAARVRSRVESCGIYG